MTTPTISAIDYIAVNPNNVGTVGIGVGEYRFFVSDGTVYTGTGGNPSGNVAGAYMKMSSTGAITPLVPVSFTAEDAQDAVGSLFADSNQIDFTYNDAGNIETARVLTPVTALVTGAAQTITAADIGRFFRRSNAGSPWAATLPTLTAADNGYTVKIQNIETAVANFGTITGAGSEAFGELGATTYKLKAGSRQTFVWDGNSLSWRFDAGNGNLLRTPTAAPTAGDFVFFLDADGLATTSAASITASRVSDFTEAAQDAVDAMLTNSSTLSHTYNDAGNTESFNVTDSPSLQGQNGAYYLARGNHTGTQASATISDFTEASQDVIGALLVSSATVSFAYNDAGNAESVNVITTGLDLATTTLRGAMSPQDKVTVNNLWYDVTNYNVLTTNTGAQNQTAMQSLINTAGQGATFYFPASAGNYPFTGTLTITTNYQKFKGAGQIASVLFCNNTNVDLFFLTDGVKNCQFEDMGFWSTATATAGACINSGTVSGTGCPQFNVSRCGWQGFGGSWFNAIVYNGSNGALVSIVSDCIINNFTNYGIALVGNTSTPSTFSALMISKTVMNGNINGSSGAVAGIYIQQAGAVQITDSDVIQCQINMLLAPITSSSQVVASVYVSNTYFDSSYGSCVKLGGTQPIVRCQFNGCSFTMSANAVAGSAAFEISNTAANAPAGIDLLNCKILNTFSTSATSNGVLISSGADIQIIGCRIAGWTNGIQATPSTPAGSMRLAIIGNTIGPTGAIKGNTTGILLNAGATTFGMVQILDNTFPLATAYGAANTTNITDNSTILVAGGIKQIANNGGLVTPRPNNVTATAIPLTTVTNVDSLGGLYIPANVRLGTKIRITVYATNAATAQTLTTTLRFGTANSNADAAVKTDGFAAGTAAVGGGRFVFEVDFFTATTMGVTAQFFNLNNAATGISTTVIQQSGLATPATISTAAASFLGVYFSSATAAAITIRSVAYEVVSQ